ncbi:hypothetical protein [Nocardiopsis valliformis]|uniref:hypothetical protein n=1 Tax=Nocardiopsis valliformis TaxID=239974 RepID=UPI000347B9A0|nr:hypothetical protein [Nocardiopsis valliformis]
MTIDSALISPADHRPGLAAHFAGYVARHARQQGLLGGDPEAQSAPSNQGAPGEPLDLRPVEITMDHENRSVSLHTGDEEFAALLNSLSQQG